MAKDQISRRDFIKGIAAGAAGMVALGAIEFADSATKNAGSASVAAGSDVVASGLTFTPGTYTATEQGLASPVTVTMTFDETMITDVSIDCAGETPDIGAVIGPEMAQKIVSAQSADVDAVSGATITSDAIRKAAVNCISQAAGQEITLGEHEEKANEWLGEAPEIDEASITETIDTECLIVGLGTGGWIAALTAADPVR